MEKTIFILLDGCGFTAASENLGFPEHLVEQRLGAKYLVRSELPSLSRPMYETLLTGLPVFRHGITNNMVVRRSESTSVFDLCRLNGLKTAAAAYYWISELYMSAPFSRLGDRIQLDASGLIQNGIYYFEDDYPDSHVFADAEFLRGRSDPDFLMVHSMNIDDRGHRFTAMSKEYRFAVSAAGVMLSFCLPAWMRMGYNIVVTADHGMDGYGIHGGTTEIERNVPLYLFAAGARAGDFSHGTPVSQLAVAPLLCRLLGVEKSKDMTDLSEFGVNFFED